MAFFIIFRIIGYCIIIYDVILLFFSMRRKAKNTIYIPRYIYIFALWFFLAFSIIFLMSFNYHRTIGYNIGTWISGIVYLLFTGGIGTILLMLLGNWRFSIFEEYFEYYNIFGRKKTIMFCDIDKEKSFYRVVKNPHVHIEYQGHKIFIQNWYIEGDFLLLYKTLKEIRIKKLKEL